MKAIKGQSRAVWCAGFTRHFVINAPSDKEPGYERLWSLLLLETLSTIQNGVTSSLKHFHNFLGLVRLDPDFIEGRAKVFEKHIEM